MTMRSMYQATKQYEETGNLRAEVVLLFISMKMSHLSVVYKPEYGSRIY